MNAERTKKEQGIRLSFVAACCLLTAAFTVFLMAGACRYRQFLLLETVCGGIVEKQPDAAEVVASVLKEYQNKTPEREGSMLRSLGYRPADFPPFLQGWDMVVVTVGVLAGISLLFLCHTGNRRRIRRRVGEMTDWLYRVNGREEGLLLSPVEDEFSGLQDEIYKTLTTLRQMSSQALEARNRFADNLSNIAHQLKTPVTAISLSVQTMRREGVRETQTQIGKQLTRLSRLEEALLLLARIDAGTLELRRRETDVFTLLMLAADNLQELFRAADIAVDIPELGEMAVMADPDWTMEALMNLLKNCMEHMPPGGTVHCMYEQNPLYTQIRIWDEGEGFAGEDLPHLFERFYRGRHAGTGGVGIGLAIAREILEEQSGTIRARNLPEGGACFEVRFYGK